MGSYVCCCENRDAVLTVPCTKKAPKHVTFDELQAEAEELTLRSHEYYHPDKSGTYRDNQKPT